MELYTHSWSFCRSFYRLPLSFSQKAKVARVLTALNKGTIAQYQGKALEEINEDGDGK